MVVGGRPSREGSRIKMQSVASKNESKRTTTSQGVVYRINCQNPGCGFKFDLKITPENAGLLSGPIAYPHCKRHAGFLKSQGRLGEQLFTAKLFFPALAEGHTPHGHDS